MSDKQFPARLTPFSRNLERTMGEGVDFDGFRTVIQQTPEGEAMLRTRGGMPEFSLKKPKKRKVMPSCVRAPLTETDYAERTYYPETIVRSTCGVFTLRVKYVRSISFLDFDNNPVVFYFSSPVGDAVAPENSAAITFVESAFSTRTHYDGVLTPISVPGGIEAVDYNGQPYKTPTLWDQVHFEQKPIRSMQFKVNDVLDVTYLFEQESATGNSTRPVDEHACMARDLIEISASRNSIDALGETSVIAVRLQYLDTTKYGEIALKSPGGFLQLVSTDFCNVTRMGVAWALSDLGLFGTCLHGVARGYTVTEDSVTTTRIEVVLHDGTIKMLPSGIRYQALDPFTLRAGCHVSRHPLGLPSVERSGLGREEDVRERRQWFNYALFSQNLGALSGITWAANQGAGTTAWMYYDTAGGGCYIYIPSAILFSAASITIEPTPAAEFGHAYDHRQVALTAPYRRAMDPGALFVAARTEDGRRTIFTTYEASDRVIYENAKYASLNATDFWELLISGDVDLDATNCGLSFSFRLMDEADRQYYKHVTRDQNESRTINIGSDEVVVCGVTADAIRTDETRERTTYKLGCFFEGDVLRWIDVVVELHTYTRHVQNFTPDGDASCPYHSQAITRVDNSISLRVDGVIVDARAGGYSEDVTTFVTPGVSYAGGVIVQTERHDDTTNTNPSSASLRMVAKVGNAWNDYTYGVVATYSPHVFGLATVRSTTTNYVDATWVTFHDLHTPTGVEPQSIEGMLINGATSYFSYEPSQNKLYATWNPATGALHTDTMPCCWI